MARIDGGGILQIADMRRAFPWQQQPSIQHTDYLTNFTTANIADQMEWHFDRLTGCGYPREVFVPHNQTLGADSDYPVDSVVDLDKYQDTSMPTLTWDQADTSFDNVLQCFPNRPHGYQYIDCMWDSTDDPSNSYLTLHAYLDETDLPQDATAYGNVACQGIRFLVSRTINPRTPPAAQASWEIQWVASMRTYALLVLTNERAELRISEDKGNTWKTLNAHFQLGVPIHQVQGNAYPGMEGGGIPVEVLMMNTSMVVTCGAQVSPYKIPIADPRPTQPPSLSVDDSGGGGGGGLDPGSYAVGYTYVHYSQDQDGNSTEEETALSPISWITLDGGGAISVDPGNFPSGVDAVYIYVSTPNGMTFFTSSDGSSNTSIDSQPESGNPPPTFSNVLPTIREITVNADVFTQFHVEAHPIKWRTHAQLISNPFAFGFSPSSETPPYFILTGMTNANVFPSGGTWPVSWPDGSVITVETVTDPAAPDHQYQLTIDNQPSQDSDTGGVYQGQPYADFTAALTKVTVKVDGLWTDVMQGQIAQPIPVSVVVRSAFDQGGLTIRRSCELTFNNFHGDYAGTAANYACYVALGIVTSQDGVVLAEDGPFSKFTGFLEGYSYDRPNSAQAYMRATGVDQMRLPEEAILMYTPDFDGMNIYYVARFLANYAGITDSQIGFMDMVPEDPFESAAGDPNPYFLPFGDGMNPWTPRARTMPVAELFNYVRQTAGFLWYMDEDGFMQFHQWIIPPPSEPDWTFTETPTSQGDLPTEMWNLHVSTSNHDVKNQIVVIGTNPYSESWNMSRAVRTNWDSIDGGDPNNRPDNFKGYKAQMFYSSPMFASQDYSERAADQLMVIEGLTAYQCNLDTWLKAGVRVLDVIQILDSKSGAWTVPFYVMETIDTLSVMGCRNVIRTQLVGKFLAPDLGQDFGQPQPQGQPQARLKGFGLAE